MSNWIIFLIPLSGGSMDGLHPLFSYCVDRFGTQPDRSVFSLWAWHSIGALTAVCWSTMSHLQTPLRLWTAGGMSSWSRLALATLRTSLSSCWETRSTWRTDRSVWAPEEWCFIVKRVPFRFWKWRISLVSFCWTLFIHAAHWLQLWKF